MASRELKVAGSMLLVMVFLIAVLAQIGSTAESPSNEIENLVVDDYIPPAPAPTLVAEKSPSDYPLVSQAAAMSAKGDGLGLLLNLSGELCAEVISTKHLSGDSFEVTCQESRAGGTARYRFNAADGKSVRIG